MDENAEDCAKRELKEETGLKIETMRQLGAFTKVNRDPRGRTVSIAYYTVIEKDEVKGSDDAAQARWFPIDSIPTLTQKPLIRYLLSMALRQRLYVAIRTGK